MKQFFGAFFGSIVGLVVAGLLAVLLVAALIKASVGSVFGEKQRAGAAKENSILRINLEGRLVERHRDNPLEEFGDVAPLVDVESIGLHRLLGKIKAAATDDNIKGLYLRFGNLQAGMASLRELRNELAAFRASGKFVYCYGEDYTQSQYYVASVGDKVFLHPEGSVMWKGLGMNLLFFKNALDRLGIEMQVFRHGKFKSAVEPLVLEKMSEANREQSEQFLSTMWQTMVAEVAASRKLDENDLNRIADSLLIRLPEDAQGRLVDALAYEDEVFDELKKKTSADDEDKPPFVEYTDYTGKPREAGGTARIAVIYANGPITSGDGSDDESGSQRLTRAIRQARTDDKIKGIVLRVNSPGGSALASDVIWREVHLAGKTKPVAVSMGDVAASGGYYISCGAARIFAQPNTITGSIGVFGVMPNFRATLENKLGITIDTVNTNAYSDMASGLRPVTGAEQEYIQTMVERVYETFTGKVAQGRDMPAGRVDSVGQGRVWSGADAQRLGLVDELGGLQDAVKYIAGKAGLKEYRITELPRLKGPFDGFLNNTEKEVAARMLERNLGRAWPYWQHIGNLMSLQGVQARLPFDVVIQ